MLFAFADAAPNLLDFDDFCVALLESIRAAGVGKPGVPRPLRLADVKHWVRRRWPLPPEAAYGLASFAQDYIADEGWIVQPHGEEIAAIIRLRDANIRLEQAVPDYLRTIFHDGEVQSVTAMYLGDRLTRTVEHRFDSEDELLDWLGAPLSIADAWSLFELKRVQADEASHQWLEDCKEER